MSKLLEFILGSIVIAVFSVAFLFFFALHYLLGVNRIADCAWYGSVRAWIDSNGDGLINHGEPPLDDVKIHVNNVEDGLINVGWPAITDKDGDVQFNVPIPGCSDTVFEIYVEIPEGYRITTRPRIEVIPDVREAPGIEPIYYFGFVSDR